MNQFMLNRVLSHYAANVPSQDEVNALYEKNKGMLSGITPEQLEALKPKYPTLVPAIDLIKSRIAGTLAGVKSR